MIAELPVVTVPAVRMLESTILIARNYDRSFYESLYLAIAAKKQAVLITAEEKLAKATAPYLPVNWIGAIYN